MSQVNFMPRRALLAMLCALCMQTAAGADLKTPQNDGAAKDVNADTQCVSDFSEIRTRLKSGSSQSVILQSDGSGISPYVTLHHKTDGNTPYTLWQTLNGDIRGYALRNLKGFDYVGSILQPLPLSWHPTLIWDKLFVSDIDLKNYSCVLTGRTRVMGKKVSLLRLVPQEGLRYSFLIAKDDDSDFPVELSVIDGKGNTALRLTTMESRVIVGMDFPIRDSVFDGLENQSGKSAGANKGHLQSLGDMASDVTSDRGADGTANGRLTIADSNDSSASSEIMDSIKANDASSAPALKERIPVWRELNIPDVFTVTSAGRFPEGGINCIYQEFSDGLTSFRVYRNDPGSVYYPVLNNTTLTVLRKNTIRYEYTVVGEIPLNLAEYVLTGVDQR